MRSNGSFYSSNFPVIPTNLRICGEELILFIGLLAAILNVTTAVTQLTKPVSRVLPLRILVRPFFLVSLAPRLFLAVRFLLPFVQLLTLAYNLTNSLLNGNHTNSELFPQIIHSLTSNHSVSHFKIIW